MELSKLAIIGLVTLGVGAIVLAGYVVYQLGRNRVVTPPPQADARDVPDTTERIPTNVTPLNAYGRELRGTGT